MPAINNSVSNSESDFRNLFIGFSGVNKKIIGNLPEEDKRPYLRIGTLNFIISIFFSASCYFIGKILFDFVNIFSIIACIFYFGGSLYLLQILTRNLINAKNSESKFTFFLIGILLSFFVGASVLLILANNRKENYDGKIGKVYNNLDSFYKRIETRRVDSSGIRFMDSTHVFHESTPHDIDKYITNQIDSVYWDYKNFSDEVFEKKKLLILRDSSDFLEKTVMLDKKIGDIRERRFYRFYSNNSPFFYDDTLSSWKYASDSLKDESLRKVKAANDSIKVFNSISLSDLAEIAFFFDPGKFKTRSFAERYWLISYFADSTAVVFFMLVMIVMFLFFFFILITSNTYDTDFYQQLLTEEKKLQSEDLEKKRKKIVDEFRIQAEIQNTKIALQNIDQSDAANVTEVTNVIKGLNENDLSPAKLKAASEFEFSQGRFEKALEYINKAIEISDEINFNNKDYTPDPEFYKLKSNVLGKLGSDEAKYALDRFVELNDEKKFQVNLSKEIALQRIELENLPFYGNFKWNFTPGINILLGKNGYGKSHLFGLLIALLYDDKKKISEWIPVKSSITTRAKLYLASDHPINEELLTSLSKTYEGLLKMKEEIEQKIRHATDNESKQSDPASSKFPVQPIHPELEKINLEIQSTIEKMDAEQRRIMGSKDGITSNIGRIPILGIPDSRFIDKSESGFGNNKILSEDLKRDGAMEFLYARSFADIIKKGLFIVAQSNSSDFRKEPYSLIERVISELAGTNLAADPTKSNITSLPFFKFVKVDTISTTGDYKFFVKSEESDEEFPLQKISQGTFSILAIFLMIYRFLNELRPNSKNILEERAIVFIDEIDAHLHPSWEQKIIGILRREFPNVQFIISAHSPLIVGGCLENEVSVLKRSDNGFTIEQSKDNFIGYSTADLLKKVFEIEDKDEQYLYYAALGQQEDSLKEQLLKYEIKKEHSYEDIKEMDELSKKLNYIRDVKKIKSKYVETSVLKTQKQSLQAQVDILKEKIKNLQSTQTN